MVRIEEIGKRPHELNGWPLEWRRDHQNDRMVLVCAAIEVGALSDRILAALGRDAQLTVTVDWDEITKFLRGSNNA